MIKKRNLLLLLLLLPLLLLITWLEPGIERPVVQPLTSLQPNLVDRIIISDSSGRRIELKRRSDHWSMLQPTPGSANGERIKQLLGITRTRSHTSFRVDDEKLAEYGLKPAHLMLQLNELQLLFGDNDPVHQRRYVKIGDQVHLIDDGFQHHLLALPAAFEK